VTGASCGASLSGADRGPFPLLLPLCRASAKRASMTPADVVNLWKGRANKVVPSPGGKIPESPVGAIGRRRSVMVGGVSMSPVSPTSPLTGKRPSLGGEVPEDKTPRGSDKTPRGLDNGKAFSFNAADVAGAKHRRSGSGGGSSDGGGKAGAALAVAHSRKSSGGGGVDLGEPLQSIDL
jgi:hypothetical protein